jgi:hypothetical protein
MATATSMVKGAKTVMETKMGRLYKPVMDNAMFVFQAWVLKLQLAEL